MFAIFREIGALVCVPVCLFIAWHTWIRSGRAQMPPWRNGVALTALLIMSVNWAVAMLLDAPELLHARVEWPAGAVWAIYMLAHPLAIAAFICAFALKRNARIGAVLASVMLLSCWPGGYS